MPHRYLNGGQLGPLQSGTGLDARPAGRVVMLVYSDRLKEQ